MLSARFMLLVAAALTASQAPLRIRVVDYPRPVSQAVRDVERHFGFVVTYEDHSYIHPADIVDITDAVSRNPDKSKRIFGMRPGSIVLTHVPRSGPLAAQVEGALLDILEASRKAGNTGDFRVECVSGGCHVIPTAIRGRSGRREHFTPLLNAQVSLPAATLSGAEFMQAFVGAVSRASGGILGIGMFPNNLMLQRTREFPALRGSARDVFWRGLRAIDPRLSWQLLCDAGDDAHCALNVHLARVNVTLGRLVLPNLPLEPVETHAAVSFHSFSTGRRCETVR